MEIQVYINCYITYKQLKKKMNLLLNKWNVVTIGTNQAKYHFIIDKYAKNNGYSMINMCRFKSSFSNKIKIYKIDGKICAETDIKNPLYF